MFDKCVRLLLPAALLLALGCGTSHTAVATEPVAQVGGAAAPGGSVSRLQKPEADGPKPPVKESLLETGNNQFAVRESATKELEMLGEIAAPACRKVLEQKPAAEPCRRLEALLEKQSRERLNPSSERLRTLRAVEVLEHIGTPGARQVLETLAKGAPEARATQEAQASLDCLGKRPSAD